MADPIHVHSQFDPEQRAVAIVDEVEREALDEDMVSSTLRRMMEVFAQRMRVCDDRVNAERVIAVKAARSERLRSNQKGVVPAPLQGRILRPDLKAVGG